MNNQNTAPSAPSFNEIVNNQNSQIYRYPQSVPVYYPQQYYQWPPQQQTPQQQQYMVPNYIQQTPQQSQSYIN